MKLLHLSHTDLDGYCCQFITRLYFSDRYYLNSDYGKEIDIRLNNMIEIIENSDKSNKFLFLITDLNLSMSQSVDLDVAINRLIESGYDIKLLLLDHHITGLKMASRYDWYNLDEKRSATKITYDYFRENYKLEIENQDRLESLVKAVNAIDIWLEDDELFEVGKVCMRMISSARELNRVMFNKEDNDFKLFCLKEASKVILQKDAHILLDEEVHFIKKRFFKEDMPNDSIDNLISGYIIKILGLQKERLLIHYKDKVGVLTYSIRGISVMANQFLKANNDIDFFMNVSPNAMVSIRACGNFKVNEIAKKYFSGGGHKNAAGGKLKIKFNSYSYDKIKHLVTEYINDKI